MKKLWKNYILVVSIITIIFLFVVNYVTNPDFMWAFYPLLPIILLNIIFFNSESAKKLSFSIIGSLITIVYFIGLNRVMGSSHPYYIYTSFALIWWPLVHYLVLSKNHLLFSVLGYILTASFFFIVNKVTATETIWYIYPVISLILWPVTLLFITINRKNKTKINTI